MASLSLPQEYLLEEDVTVLGRMATIDSPEIFILDSFCLVSFALSGASSVSWT